MHCILSLLKHVSRKNEGRRVETEDPAPSSSPDHPLEKEKEGETGIKLEGLVPGFTRVGSGEWGGGAGKFPLEGRERISLLQ